MPSGSLTSDAVIAGRRFTADAVIIGFHLRHWRDRDHIGTQDDTTVVLSTAIGSYAAGTTLHDVLVSLNARIQVSGSANTIVGVLTANAFIVGFRAYAVIAKGQTGSLTADAWFAQGSSFTANAVKRKTQSGSFTANAALV